MNREKPILFNTDMVRAILDGRKTVTRRVVKPQPVWVEQDKKYRVCPSGWWWGLDRIRAIDNNELFAQMLKVEAAPYNVGDILYVRETWAFNPCDKCGHACDTQAPDIYSSAEGCFIYRANYGETEDDSFPPSMFKWRPSIHMPREAARIFLRVTDVRVERLQDSFTKHGGTIFEIRAEGINIPEECRDCIDAYGSPCCIDTTEDDGSECGMLDYPRSDFADLWDSTVRSTDRDRYGWAANPWVWVIAFERCTKPKEAIDGSV